MKRLSTLGLVLVAISVDAGMALAGDACGTKADQAVAARPSKTGARTIARGKTTGRFDGAMSGVCRFGCATKLRYQPRDVLAQPVAQSGKLTQCPVSGVVFTVDAKRPRVRVAGDSYVTCCDTCAEKLQHTPRRYVKV